VQDASFVTTAAFSSCQTLTYHNNSPAVFEHSGMFALTWFHCKSYINMIEH